MNAEEGSAETEKCTTVSEMDSSYITRAHLVKVGSVVSLFN